MSHSLSLIHSPQTPPGRNGKWRERLKLEGESEAVGWREAVRKERGDGRSMDLTRHQIQDTPQDTPQDTKPHPPLLTPLTLHLWTLFVCGLSSYLLCLFVHSYTFVSECTFWVLPLIRVSCGMWCDVLCWCGMTGTITSEGGGGMHTLTRHCTGHYPPHLTLHSWTLLIICVWSSYLCVDIITWIIVPFNVKWMTKPREWANLASRFNGPIFLYICDCTVPLPSVSHFFCACAKSRVAMQEGGDRT